MNTTLAIQLILSFVIGGCFIALLTLLAERANESISGIIMMFPTTIVLGLFFLGYTTSAQKVAMIIPAILIPIGLVIISSVIYIYYSLFFLKYLPSKRSQIIVTFIASSITWFVLAAPFAITKFSSVVYGTIGYVVLIVIAHYLLNKHPNEEGIPRLRYTTRQIIFRAAFIGSIIAMVVLLGKLLDPFWGGIFTMYPAATLAALVILHYYYEPRQLFHFMKKAPVGSVALFIYAISVMILFPRLGIVKGTVSSYALCMVYSVVVIRYRRRTSPHSPSKGNS